MANPLCLLLTFQVSLAQSGVLLQGKCHVTAFESELTIPPLSESHQFPENGFYLSI